MKRKTFSWVSVAACSMSIGESRAWVQRHGRSIIEYLEMVSIKQWDIFIQPVEGEGGAVIVR